MNDRAQSHAASASFEETFRGLQEEVARLEEGGLPLHQAIDTFERGMELANRCGTILDEAELRVTRVLQLDHADRDEPAF